MPAVALKRKPSRKTEVRLGADSAGIVMTPEEFDRADCDDRWRYELIHGVLVVSPAPLMNERDPNDELGFRLRSYQHNHAEGASLDKTLPEHEIQCGENRRRADRVLWCGLGRLPALDEAPTVAVEFVSKGKRSARRDYEEKKRDYRSAGVVQYWIFDRFTLTLTVSALHKKKAAERVFQKHQVFTTELLPGFELPLKSIFDLANCWPAK